MTRMGTGCRRRCTHGQAFGSSGAFPTAVLRNAGACPLSIQFTNTSSMAPFLVEGRLPHLHLGLSADSESHLHNPCHGGSPSLPPSLVDQKLPRSPSDQEKRGRNRGETSEADVSKYLEVGAHRMLWTPGQIGFDRY